MSTRVALAYAAIWILWGSTYLPIRVVVRAGTPLGAASARFLLAGILLVTLALLRAHAPPTREQARSTAVLAFLFFLCGYGPLFWAEQRIASGPAALLVAATPVWILLMDAATSVKARAALFDARTVLGVLAGLAGVVVLIPGGITPDGRSDIAPAVAILLGSLTWSAGTLLMRRLALPASAIWSSGLQMLIGGGMLAVAAAATGEWRAFSPEAVTVPVLLALLWLVVAGSVVAFLAYVWLIAREPVSRVATYAYVNPLVALLLGWALGEERITASVAVGAALVVAGVAMTLRGKRG